MSACFKRVAAEWMKPCLWIFLFYPFSKLASSSTVIDDELLILFDLTLPFFSALIIRYGARAFPALMMFLVFSLLAYSPPEQQYIVNRLLSAFFSYVVYMFWTNDRRTAGFKFRDQTKQRICVFVFLNSLCLMIFQFTSPFGLHPPITPKLFISIQNLINIQSIINSCLTGIPFCYLLMRFCSRPVRRLRSMKQTIRLLYGMQDTLLLSAWCILLTGIVYCLIAPQNGLLLFTDYSILLLLPLMLWGIVYISPVIVGLLWTLILIILSHFNEGYIPPGVDSLQLDIAHQALISTVIFIFSLIIVIADMLVSRNHLQLRRLRHASLTENNTGLSNLRALKLDFGLHPSCGLSLVYYPELWRLSEENGLDIRFTFVRSLVKYLQSLLNSEIQIYYCPEYGIFIRQSVQDMQRIRMLYQQLESYRFEWRGNILGLHCGLGYTHDFISEENVILIAGQLYKAASNSLISGIPELVSYHSFFLSGAKEAGFLSMRNLLQKAIDQQSFELFAQPIVSTKGLATYHEILIRLRTEDNQRLFPDTFLPLSRDAGISALVDMTVLEQTFRFMQCHDEHISAQRFALNLMPQTLCCSTFIRDVELLFQKYQILPERIIFEVIESDFFSNHLAEDNLRQLRQFGCKIAIDDFGTGYASHSRLRNLDADILKIDGSFIREILETPFDYDTVTAFCQAAHSRNMEVVAEYVENEAIQAELVRIGIDWLQGYHTGKPVPVETLAPIKNVATEDTRRDKNIAATDKSL